MADLKIANWNIEWMNRWFTSDSEGPPRLKNSQEAGFDVTALATRVAQVIAELDADILTIQEGPSRHTEMELYVKQFLQDGYSAVGPAGKGQQKLFALVKKDSEVIERVTRIESELGFDFDDVWEVDIDADMMLDEYKFTRPPLVMVVKAQTGRSFHLISLHAKSKYVHNGRRLWEDPLRRQEFVEMALKARRRISAEAARVREYVDALFANGDSDIIITGDFNDGPGLDLFEKHYLTHNVAGLIAGSPYEPQRMLRHAFVDLMLKEQNYTAEFFDFVDGKDRKVLLDHIFVSASLFWTGEERTARGQIEHEIYKRAVLVDESGRASVPSDHRPQSVTVSV